MNPIVFTQSIPNEPSKVVILATHSVSRYEPSVSQSELRRRAKAEAKANTLKK